MENVKVADNRNVDSRLSTTGAIDSEPIRARGIIVNYTMLSKYGNCTRLLKIKNKLKIGCFYK